MSHSDSGSDCNVGTEFSSVDSGCAEVVVVRHGETAWNAEKKIQGQLDVELNDIGRHQAVAVSNELKVADRLSKEPRISAVYSSDLKRAFETAQVISRSCGGIEEIANANPTAYKAFVSHRTDQEIPGGGESLDQLYDRCTSALEEIARKHEGERVVVVTHGGVLTLLHKRACPNRRPGKVLNTSVSIFHLSSNSDDWKIKTWCDVSHLNPMGFLKSGFGGDLTSG